MNSTARVPTNLPRRYMSQLCKHFEHKLPVTLGETEAQIQFPMGVCALQATYDAIVMTAEAADQEGLERLQDVVARHLVRFAFREPMEVVWEAA
jgi:hypothetical protein